ncbi:MAG: insulinase family protein [Chloroflexi bacterium]|nr:insulinase family protein [Chloroflexota bacterium]
MYQKTTLDNGLRVVTSSMPATRSVSIITFIGTGSRYETDTEAGISHFIEHLLFKGTKKRPTSKDISEAIEGIGGYLNAATNKELTMYWCKVSQPHFGVALDVLSDMLFHALFNPPDVEKERQVIIEEICLSKDSPEQQVNMLIDELMWPEHPLGRDIAGTPESVAKLSRDMVLDYIQGEYLAPNAVVAIAGNIEHGPMVEQVSRAMQNWTRPGAKRSYVACQERVASRLLIEGRDTEQAHLCLGVPGLSLVHPKRFILDIMNTILGEGMSSRLFTEIRDKRGLTYSIHSSLEHMLDCGTIIISTAVDPPKLSAMVEGVLDELAKMKNTVTSAELTKAKEQTKGRLLLHMEDSRAVAGWIGGQEMLLGRILTLDDVIEKISTVTLEEVEQMAHEIFQTNQMRLAVVGPVPDRKALEQQLGI